MAIDYPETIDIQDANDEIWFDIINRTITPKEGQVLKDILVQNDANSRNFGFMIQRYFENVDLFTKSIRIHYVNSLNQHDSNIAHSVKIVSDNEDVISFMWLITDKVCIETGNVEFAVEFFDTDGYDWFTKPTKVTVEQGIYTIGEITVPDDWYKIIRDEYDKKLDKNQGAENSGKVMMVDDDGVLTPVSLPNLTPIKVKTVELLSANWGGENSPYSQTVTIDDITTSSKIDIQPTPEQLDYFQKEEISLVARNKNGVVTIYAIGTKPTTDLNIQVMITEVVIE